MNGGEKMFESFYVVFLLQLLSKSGKTIVFIRFYTNYKLSIRTAADTDVKLTMCRQEMY